MADDEMENLFLKNALTEKHLEHGEKFGFCGMQGWRRSNEDFHKHLIPFDHHSWKLWSFFSIFDGHNGIDTAKNGSNLLGQHLIDAFNEKMKLSNDETVHSSEIDFKQFEHLIKETFHRLDKELHQLIHDQSGSVCIATLIGPENIYLINLGDSRGIIISNDGKVLSSTKDHKPDSRKEKERIVKAGGHVTKMRHDVARVERILAVSRALGDYSIDKHIVSPSPDIIQCSIKSSSPSFVVLACDGLWDVLENEQVAKFVGEKCSNTSLQDMAAQLVDQAFQLGTMDNISIYIIKI